MKPFKIAIWSVGEHAKRNVIPAIEALGDVELVGAFTRSQEVRDSLENLFFFSSAEEMLSCDDVNAIYISSPNSLHGKQIELALKYGKHVLVEKTAFTCRSDAVDALAEANRANLIVMEAFMYRFHNQYSQLKTLIAKESYGKARFATVDFGFPHLPSSNIRYNKALGGGALNDAGAYTLSVLGDLFTTTSLRKTASGVVSDNDYDVDTTGYSVFEADSLVIHCRWAFGLTYRNQLDIWCDDGIIRVARPFSKPANFDSTIEVCQNGKVVEVIETGQDNHFKNMITYFMNEISSGSLRENDRTLKQRLLLDEIENII